MGQGNHNSSSPFHVMAKVTGPICNLDCRYCFYLEKEQLYPGELRWEMPLDILESFIKQEIAGSNTSHVPFAWQGGEPTLLGVDYFAKVVELQQKHAGGRIIDNALQTNGTLLDDEWCAFLEKNRFLVGVSIDGPRALHDGYRSNKGGGGSFDRTLRGIELLKKHGVEFNTLTVVHRLNSPHPLDVYRFLKDIGSRFMQFIPVVERISHSPVPGDLRLVPPESGDPAQVTEWSVEPSQYGTFLCAIFDEWVRNDVGSVFVQLFDVALEAWLGMQPSLCVFRETCGDALVIEHNGDLYSCDHFVYPEHRLGNLTAQSLESMASSGSQVRFGTDKLDSLPGVCRECEVRFVCNGECPKHRFVAAGEGGGKLNYLCEGYKRFFRHIDPSMRFMAEELRNERAPANVMRWLREQDAAPHRRNELCYCGSGKKYKRCHGI